MLTPEGLTQILNLMMNACVPVGVDDDDDDDDKDEDAVGVHVPIGFDEVMFCPRDPVTSLSTLSCTHWKSLIIPLISIISIVLMGQFISYGNVT